MAVPKVTIQGKIILPTGDPAPGGEISIRLSGIGKVEDGGSTHTIFGVSPPIRIAEDGSVNFTLVPTESITPNNLRYVTTYRFGNGVTQDERWTLNNAPNPIDIGDITRVAE